MPQPEKPHPGDDSFTIARPFYSDGGLNVETYDDRTAGFPGEIDWWVRRARDMGGPVLEVACGTGRITWPIARAGLEIVGLDLNAGMLRAAEAKRGRELDEVNARIRFVRGDMTDFSLPATFALAIIPSRAFQALLTPDAQRRSLASIRRHLRRNGRLIIDVFDPRLDWILPDRTVPGSPERPSVIHPATGNRVTIEILSRRNDSLRQVLAEIWRFTETGPGGEIVRGEEELLELRWSYRYEMRHLFELCGFSIENEYADFSEAPPTYGREQIWVTARSDR